LRTITGLRTEATVLDCRMFSAPSGAGYAGRQQVVRAALQAETAAVTVQTGLVMSRCLC
jgi:hypothetical protein